jgi:hypothetical protein
VTVTLWGTQQGGLGRHWLYWVTYIYNYRSTHRQLRFSARTCNVHTTKVFPTAADHGCTRKNIVCIYLVLVFVWYMSGPMWLVYLWYMAVYSTQFSISCWSLWSLLLVVAALSIFCLLVHIFFYLLGLTTPHLYFFW